MDLLIHVMRQSLTLPVLLHIRDESEKAYEDAYKIIKEIGIKKGILHAYTGN